MTLHRGALRALAASALALVCTAAAWADEASIRRTLTERYPKWPGIDEIVKSPIAGLYEVRVGADLFFVDEKADYIISADQGHIVDTRSRADLTEARIEKLSAIDVNALAFKDAVVLKQGTGARRLVVFEDPNCGYCRQLERDLASLKDVTIYMFLLPILGPDSVVKSRDIWCAKEPAKAWRNWMLSGDRPAREMSGKCDISAIERNTDFAHRHRIQGTPAIVFDDGTRSPGVMPLDKLEKQLAAAAKKG